MKKLYLILLAMGASALLAACTAAPGAGATASGDGSSQPPVSETEEAGDVLSAKVMAVNGDTILVAGEEDPTGLYTVPADTPVEGGGQVTAGAAVEIGFSGMILESYPAQLAGPVFIRVREEGDDLVGLYRTVLNDLYEKDEGLNEGIEFIAFDLTKAENLTEAEKNALAYLLWTDTQVETRVATAEELKAEGLLITEGEAGFMELTTGLLLSIDVSEVTDSGFRFSAEKWRSSLGAYFFHDCTASRVDGAWGYELGEEMIS